jgi:hypothetical protein
MRIVIVVACAAACTSAPADVMGTYTGPLTRGDNGCNLVDWTPGMVITDLAFDVTQSGNAVSITATGSEATVLDNTVSGHTFTGSVSDVSLQVTIVGTRMRMMQTCMMRLDAAIVASASGTSLDGELHYRETVLDPSCLFFNDAGMVTSGAMGCDSVATFTDSR